MDCTHIYMYMDCVNVNIYRQSVVAKGVHFHGKVGLASTPHS